jgi:hypothetical protein
MEMQLRPRLLAAAGGILLLGATGTADGGLVTTTAGIAGGELTMRQPGAVVLEAGGPDQAASGDLGTVVVVDARGSGAGWRLRIAAAGDGAGELSVTGVRVEPRAGRAPTNRIGYPIQVRFGADEPVDLYSAAPGSGMGTFALTARVVARVPAGAVRRATVTLDLAAGP